MYGLHGLISNDGAVIALYIQHCSWLLTSAVALGMGDMKNKFPLKAQKTGALNSRRNFMLVKVGKTPPNP